MKTPRMHKGLLVVEPVERKYIIEAHSIEHPESVHDEYDSVLFLAKDPVFLATLPTYLANSIMAGVGERQIVGIKLLIERVARFQQDNPSVVKLPDVDDGRIADGIVAPNGPRLGHEQLPG